MNYEEAVKPFEFGDGKNYILMIHGFTGNPYELRELGKHLADNGYHTIGPRLLGHGTSKEKLLETCQGDQEGWKTWYSEVDKTIEDIKKRDYDNLFVTGLSMGGAFTLHTATKYPEVKALAPICAPVYNHQKILWFLPILKRIFTYFPQGEEIALINSEAKKDPILKENMNRYDKHVVPAIVSLRKFLHQLRAKELSKITQPILIVQSAKDTVVDPSNAEYIYEYISSKDKKLIWLSNSDHLATKDNDKHILFEEITSFFNKQL